MASRESEMLYVVSVIILFLVLAVGGAAGFLYKTKKSAPPAFPC